MDAVTLIGAISVFSVALCMGMGSIGPALGEAQAAVAAIKSMAQQPDESNNFFKSMLISMAMIESTAIYCLFVCLLIIFANPFWNYVTAAATATTGG